MWNDETFILKVKSPSHWSSTCSAAAGFNPEEFLLSFTYSEALLAAQHRRPAELMNFKWAAEEEADPPNSNGFFFSFFFPGQQRAHHRASVGVLRHGVTDKAAPYWWRFPCGSCPSVRSNPAGLPAVQRKSLAHDHHPLPHRRHPLCLPGQRHHHDALHAGYHQVLSSFVSSQSEASYSCYSISSNMFFYYYFFTVLLFWFMFLLSELPRNKEKSICCFFFPSLFGETFLWCHKGRLFLSQIWDHTPRQLLDPSPHFFKTFLNMSKVQTEG